MTYILQRTNELRLEKFKIHQGKATGEGRINRGKGSDEGSGTRSSLMWETIHIIENMGEWRPRYVIWENVKNVKSKYMRPNFDRYMVEMERLGYTNNFEVLDAREFGLPQARERVFTVSVLNGEKFEFDDLIRTPMRTLQEFLEDDASVPDVYDVTQPSVLACIGEDGIRTRSGDRCVVKNQIGVQFQMVIATLEPASY